MEIKTVALPKTTAQVIRYSLLATSFFIPFFVSGPQLLTGTLVNTILFLFVSQTTSKKTFPIAILPSIGAVLNGVLFGKFTVFLLFFLPFIWVGNYTLIYSFKLLLKKTTFFISTLISSILKFIILFSVAYLFTTTKIVPVIFLQLMGLFQLYTALIGGILALGIHTIITKKND